MKLSGVTVSDPKYIDGLKLSWVNITTVQISAGSARDTNDVTNIVLGGTQNVVITASGINGLDTGSESGSTWYSVWVVSGASGTGGLLSAHATAPTLPAGYNVAKRRIGWVYNHSDDNIQDFQMTGDGRERAVWWNETGADYIKVLDDGNATSWTVIDCSARVPTTAGEMVFWFYSAAGSTTVRVRPIGFLPLNTTNHGWASVHNGQSQNNNCTIPVPGNKEVRYKCDADTASAYMVVTGWRETL